MNTTFLNIDNLVKSDSTILWNEMFKETTYKNNGVIKRDTLLA